MITYVESIRVYLDGVHCGQILKVKGGYCYYPKGDILGGKVYSTIRQVKESIE